MHYRRIDSKKCGLLVVALLVAACFALLPSCGHQKPIPVDNSRRATLDSILGKMTDCDSLAALVAKYHDEGDVTGELIALKYQGKALRKLSRFEQAINIHSRGFTLAVNAGDTIEMISALNHIATDYSRIGELSTANGYYFKALSLSDAYSDNESEASIKSRVVTLKGIGNIEKELRHYIVADSMLHEALRGEEAIHNYEGMAISHAYLGAVARERGIADTAWYHYREAMKYNQMTGDEGGMALCHYYYGQLYMDERNFSRAKAEFQQSYDQLKQIGETWYWLDPCLGLAGVSLLMGEKEAVRGYLQEAESEAKRLNSKGHLAKAYELHYELSLLDGDSQKGLQYFIDSDMLYDSIYGLEKTEEMRLQRIDYQNQRKSGEMDHLNKDIMHLKRLRNIQRALIVLLLLMAGAIIASLVYAMRVRTRTQRMLRQVEETRSLFFTNVVHQLRTPLSAIMGATDVIAADESNFPEHQRNNLYVIKRQGQNLLELVDRILEVGSVRSAITSLDWRKGDVVALLRMTVESFRDRCIERQIELIYAPREDSCEIDTVPHYLMTIVNCLIENAINYGKEYGRITIISSVDDDKLTVRVADDGIGISKEDLAHVFEPFYRASAAEQIIEGVGIGLTVVRDMAMAMGGKVEADSMLERGTVISVTLPCRVDKGIKSGFNDLIEPIFNLNKHRKQRKNAVIEDDVDNTGKPTVLVIEDHIDVARLIGLSLGDEFAVSNAIDGEQGLNKAQAMKPDLVITDVKMPVMDGIELCRRMRMSPQLRHIPVIMLSARNSPEDRVRGIEAGADAYLVKPFVRDELYAWVNRLVESRKLMPLADEPLQEPQVVEECVGQEDSQQFLTDLNRELNALIDEGKTIDLDKVALRFKMGESRLKKTVQQITGKNVSAYIMQLRMEKAMRMLQEHQDMLVGDVAVQCGFQDVAYFSRVFRQHYGITPTQTRTNQN